MKTRIQISLLAVSAVFLLCFPAFAAKERITVQQIIEQVNADRSRFGLQPLVINHKLNLAALAKAEDMLNLDYFSHTSPGGTNPWYWFKSLGYKYEFAGENLAVGYDDAVELENSWMNSPKHRDNILSPNYTEIGIGLTYKNDKPLVIQFFGSEKDLQPLTIRE